MAPKIRTRNLDGRPRQRRRVRASKPGHYFAGEVARILKLTGTDYDQLRALLELVRGPSRSTREEKEWQTYTFADLAALRVAFRLLSRCDAKVRRRRLMQLREVCAHLRKSFGLNAPLLQARLSASGASITVEIDGRHFDASVQQEVFAEVVRDVRAYHEDAERDLQPSSLAADRKTAEGACRLAKSKQRGQFVAPVLALGRKTR